MPFCQNKRFLNVLITNLKKRSRNQLYRHTAAMCDPTPLEAPVGRGSALIWLSALTLPCLLIWAAVAPLDETIQGTGRVIPSSRVQVIQNLEGGIIKTILTAEGEHVDSNQPLIELDNTRFLAQYREADVEYQNLLVTQKRLSCEIEQTPLDLDDTPSSASEIIEQESAIYNNRRASLESELLTASDRIVQCQQELEEAQSRVIYLTKSLDLSERELALTRKLYEEGAASEMELLRLEQRINDLDGDRAAAIHGSQRLANNLQLLSRRPNEIRLNFISSALQQHKSGRVELARLSESLASHQDRLTRTLIRSPVSGIVKKIYINTQGGVVQPGMTLMEVVPNQDRLLVEVEVHPQDIAFLQPGLHATVRVSAYDPVIYGTLDGVVEHTSADTLQDEVGQSFYIVRVRTKKSYLGSSDKPLPIIPGMQTSVDIRTGRKSVLRSLVRPILRARPDMS